MQTASYWHRESDGRIVCDLCPHACRIAEGGHGLCRVREARGGQLIAAGYGRVSSLQMDPIEKKPLYHFHPGREILSVGGWGCNLRCVFCQNWSISQRTVRDSACLPPAELVRQARDMGSVGIAYTYNEPLIGIEYVLDCAKLAREAGLVNVLVTNGYIQPAPAADLLPFIDAANVDLKSMGDAFYRKHCGGSLAPVQQFILQAVRGGVHVELTNLVIPGLNSDPALFEALADWIASGPGAATPLHLSAYRPEYKLDVPATPARTLEEAYRICAAKLRFVYTGNLRTAVGRDTHCPGCGAVLIARSGFSARVTGLTPANACSACGRPLEVRRWQPPSTGVSVLQPAPTENGTDA